MNSFLKKYWVVILLFLIISLGAFLRLSDFGNLARFNADQVRDVKIVDSMFEGTYPLLGPKAGGTEFHLGPAFYYLEYASALFFGHNPAGIALFVPLLGIASIGLFFLFLRIIFSPSLSLVLTLLYATSLYVTRYSRFAWNPNVIPFFLLAFLLLLLKLVKRDQKNPYVWYMLTGLVMGIGMQLHTTLLLLMPLLFLSVHGYVAWTKKSVSYRGFFLAIALALLLHAPFFLYDVNNQGANTLSFLQGTEKKTDKTTSLLHGTLANMEFFLQGNTYALVGVEPQKSWLRIPKLFASGNTQEILLFLGGIAVFFSGLILGIRRLIQEKSEERRQSLLLVFLLTGSLFLLFLPIAEELNLRFFIVVIFLPFLFLGFMAEALLHWLRALRPLGLFLVGLAACTLITINLISYQRIYTLDEKEPESAYGGISIGEATSLTNAMKEFGATVPGQTLFLAPFEFERSLDYFVEQSGLALRDFSPEDITPNSILYLISWNKKSRETLEKYTCCYTLVHDQVFGRFTLFVLKPNNDRCDIGVITDIHATRSKGSPYYIGVDSYRPLNAFVQHMNTKFLPDFVLEIGDFIDGSENTNARALEVFQATKKIFAKSHAPTLHVMGNHETRGGGITLDQWRDFAQQENTYYAVSCKNTLITVLDGESVAAREQMGPNELKGVYFIDDKQMSWLEKTLADNPAHRKVVFMHEPLFPRSEISPLIKAERDLRTEDREHLQQLFHKHGVETVISGHVETLSHKELNGTDYFTLPGVLKSKDLETKWLESFYELSLVAGEKPKLKMFYKKQFGNNIPYQTLELPQI